VNKYPKLLLATRSRDKIREIRQILRADAGFELTTLDELGVGPAAAEEGLEIYDTFQENALAKALYFARITGMITMADDSGISVRALAGAPGVRSKRFAEETGLNGQDLDQANNELLLQRLQDLPEKDRAAHFTCAVAVALPDRPLFSTIGTSSGVIAYEPRGRDGFGYDPLFLIPELELTFAEMSIQEKNQRSHRARAFHALGANLLYMLDIGPRRQSGD
jgi:XTP/dITP diphosphohydrolase